MWVSVTFCCCWQSATTMLLKVTSFHSSHSKLWTTFSRVVGRMRERIIHSFLTPHPPTSRPGRKNTPQYNSSCTLPIPNHSHWNCIHCEIVFLCVSWLRWLFTSGVCTFCSSVIIIRWCVGLGLTFLFMSFLSLWSLEQMSSLGFAKVLKRSIERAGLLKT